MEMINKKFGSLLVISESYTIKGKGIYYLCKCDCGNEKNILGVSLRNGHTKSCGCLSRKAAMMNINNSRGCRKIDLTGMRFGRLLVIKLDSSNNGVLFWRCICDCGNEVVIRGNHLKDSNTLSCGCLSKEISSKVHTTHGMSRTRFYKIFDGIRRRCNNPNSDRYKDYGGRGIKCEWRSFESFKEDMYESYLDHVNKYGEINTSIDRINNDWNYRKDNCKWSTPKEQAQNRRKYRGN